MPLIDHVSADLSEILNDEDTGGVACTITGPAGDSLPFNVQSADIHMAIDVGTGEIITGRQAHVTVIASELVTAGWWNNADSSNDIHAESDTDKKPWLVTVYTNGKPGTFKVIKTLPSGLGRITLRLEAYAQLEE